MAERAADPFRAFRRELPEREPSRRLISAATFAPERDSVLALSGEARLPRPQARAAEALARRLTEALRRKLARGGGVEALIHEYALSSQEGVALMCLAEALLRIPDDATRDALIRDKIGPGDWQAHLGHSDSLFVNAATWGLVVTGRLSATASERGLSAALTRLLARGGEPLIRRGVELAMQLLGEQFVCGRTIEEALENSRPWLRRGFRYSYDMLGEAAMNAADSDRYAAAYARAIAAVGESAEGGAEAPVWARPGISIKLSALHPRYVRGQRDRLLAELRPRLTGLAVQARRRNIGLNIDAEEATRLDLSLDMLEALCAEPALAGWDGIGFVVQAYQKRAPAAIDHLIALARRSGHRLMIRLVKGAYWDSEIKRAQVEGLPGFPVFTRKRHTDICFLACARRLLANADAVFPQIATHNAQTLAHVHAMAGSAFEPGRYEFQCLHGMGEPLYEEVVGPEGLQRPVRIYAPVGTYRTLLAYLVRRLLENGANTSFVNLVGDPDMPLDRLVADPLAVGPDEPPLGAPHPRISAPRDLYGEARRNSAGIDLADEPALQELAAAVARAQDWRAAPLPDPGGAGRELRNPADRDDLVGHVVEAAPAQVGDAVARAAAFAGEWRAVPPADRAACLERAADRLEARMPELIGLIVREAGKSLPNAVAEVREAVDFLRYYAAEARRLLTADNHVPLGPVACISPWNFPLAIFTGQVSAALAAGNTVLAKPAEQTPLIAAQAVAVLHAAGVPEAALQLLPGDGEVGAALVAEPRICGTIFTGSVPVGRLIQRQLAGRLNPDGRPVPLVAETGGQNALIVDSSALPEQVAQDVLVSAFDSAGQRCSALRLLCLQEEVAAPMLEMIEGAMAELATGSPDRLATDVGPVIDAEAQAGIRDHIAAMAGRGRRVVAAPLPAAVAASGSFVPPTLIELQDLSELGAEVFGPVLHVLRYRREELDGLVEGINRMGYGLTFGVHSRIDETVARLADRAEAGNVYVNRNIVGAVVGVQPFGGRGLSGTGPKAGGPLYLPRLLAERPPVPPLVGAPDLPPDAETAAAQFLDWLRDEGLTQAAARAERDIALALPGAALDLPGPTGERNRYSLSPRGPVLCIAPSEAELLAQIGACLATGNPALVQDGAAARRLAGRLPPAVAARVSLAGGPDAAKPPAAVLFAGAADDLLALQARVAGLPGPIVPVLGRAAAVADYPLDLLLHEKSVSTNTAAVGGNASLMTIG